MWLRQGYDDAQCASLDTSLCKPCLFFTRGYARDGAVGTPAAVPAPQEPPALSVAHALATFAVATAALVHVYKRCLLVLMKFGGPRWYPKGIAFAPGTRAEVALSTVSA